MTVDALLVLLAIGACIFPFFALRNLPRKWAWGISLSVALFTATGMLAWHTVTSRSLVKQEFRRENLPRPRTTGGYVASDTCRSCHPSEYASWYHTYHRTMTQEATPKSVLGDFNGIHLESRRGRFYLEQRGEDFWAEKIGGGGQAALGEALGESPRPGRPTSPRAWQRVVMTTGSHQTQIYWVQGPRPNQLRIFPFAYLILKHRWVPLPDAFLKYPEQVENENIFWNFNCIQCHATAGQPRPESTGQADTRVGELGIACEACHGPAGEHVRINRHPVQRYRNHLAGPPDPTIVNPTREPHRSSSQICGQCHAVFYMLDPGHVRRNGFRYRPGDDLEQTKATIRPKLASWGKILDDLVQQDSAFLRNRYWSDGMIRVSGREYNGLVESACHQRGELSCLSCHSMHRYQDRADQLAEGMDSDRACLGCHPSYRDRIEQHTHHLADSSGSRCYNCHMPYTVYGLLKAHRSHEIDNPTVGSSIETGRPNACNLCHLDRSLGWTQRHLRQWYRAPTVPLSPEQEEVAAVLLWLLRGDAGQRALAVLSMGWDAAKEASGEQWLAPFLAELLNDPYAAVRFLAGDSLGSIPGFEELPYDSQASPQDRLGSRRKALEIWNSTPRSARGRRDRTLLIKPDGSLDRTAIHAFLSQRNDRKMDLSE